MWPPRLVVSYRNSTSNHNCATLDFVLLMVVSYRNSTSNHNKMQNVKLPIMVVSYRNSTSNHNCEDCLRRQRNVVSYRNSTSNHNLGQLFGGMNALYLIEILHQTTTEGPPQTRTLLLLSLIHISEPTRRS